MHFQPPTRSALSAEKVRAMARPPRNFSLPRAKRQLQSVAKEMAAIGSAWDHSAGELRLRVMMLLTTVEELIARFPTPPR